MPKLRLLPPQFLSPSWSIPQCRQFRTVLSSKPTTKPKPKPTPPAPARDSPPSTPSTPHLSLLEELFPEEAVKLKTPSHFPLSTRKRDRDIPPLPLSPDLEDVSSAHAKARRKNSTGSPRRRDGRIGNLSAEARGRTEMTVMVFRNASKSLCEDDFRRVVPKGKHIEGWKAQGDILKGWRYHYPYPDDTSRSHIARLLEEDEEECYLLIPLREPLTLHQTGSYLLLFPSLLAAKSYQEHLIYLHRTARTHTPTSIESPLPPPPGYRLADGEDIYQLLQEYALMPPSQRLSLRLLVQPYSPMIRALLEKGGYEEIVQDRSSNMLKNITTDTNVTTSSAPKEADETIQSRNTSVLFWIEGYQPSTFSLKEALARDGRDRGLPWSISLSRSPPGSAASRSSAFVTANTPLAITKLASPQPNAPTPTINPETESGNENDADDEGYTQLSARRVSRWIIRFDSESEARRFVRAWNRRPWPLHGRENPAHADEAPLVGVEFLW